MEKTNIKNLAKANKGITLIALVVTIIVLMIIAGISVAALMGENGLIKRAGEAKENQRGAVVQDEVRLAISENKATDEINKTKGATGGLKTKENVADDLKEKGYLRIDEYKELLGLEGEEERDTITIGSITIDFSKLPKEAGGGGSSLDATGNIRITEFSIAGTPVTDVPLPSSDFEKVANTEIDNSYVARGKADSNYAGDEFVWVPVDKDQEFTVKIEGSGNIASVVLTNPVGDTKTIASNITAPQSLTGITPTVENNVYNGEYKVTVTPQEGEAIETTLDVYSLYAFNVNLELGIAKNALGDNYESFLQSMGGQKALISAYSEPTDNDINYSARVAANGGFWIGRYEASYNASTSNAASKLSTSTRTSTGTNLTNGMLWNFISRTDALTTAKAYNTTLKSSLPTGAAWDRTLGWIYEKRNSTGKDLSALTTNSANWGNYNDDTLTNGSSDLINTGSTNETMANNIYDLAGNLAERTTENYTRGGSTNPVSRGGHYYITGSTPPAASPAASRGLYNGVDESDYIGLRLVLYK